MASDPNFFRILLAGAVFLARFRAQIAMYCGVEVRGGVRAADAFKRLAKQIDLQREGAAAG